LKRKNEILFETPPFCSLWTTFFFRSSFDIDRYLVSKSVCIFTNEMKRSNGAIKKEHRFHLAILPDQLQRINVYL